MIGIYKDEFLTYLKDNLGISPKITSKNLIIPCPYCEYPKIKDHYHLNISLELPIFHCFHSDCNKSGTIHKLMKKLEGKESAEKFIDQDKVKEFKKNDFKLSIPVEKKKIIIPEINNDQFKLKNLFLKGRLKYSNINNKEIKGLIFDVNNFLQINNIQTDENFSRMKDYICTNFIGFLTENESIVMFRNIDDNSKFRFFKLHLDQTRFLDYYKIQGFNYNSNHVILAEGIFDIFNEHIFDYTKLKNNTKLYACGLSTSFEALIKSLVFNEKIMRIDVSILADRGMSLKYFKDIKKFNSHIVDKMTIFYNKTGKDFGETPVVIEKYIL